jgi:diaminopimelate epimerase
MDIRFFKYQGTGNDFIIIDNRELTFPKTNNAFIQKLCHRQFGIGADGLMLLEKSINSHFKMIYYNADGREGSMCGNGGRCIVAFARHLGIFEQEVIFEAVDGTHKARLNDGKVQLEMGDVSDIEAFPDHFFLNTGSPHHIVFSKNIDNLDIVEIGRRIRYGAPYFEAGTNVNFVEKNEDNKLKIRTYERGVENETLSCGTGVTAAAIAAHFSGKTTETPVFIDTLGGVLQVDFHTEGKMYRNIVLTGPAEMVFSGLIKCGI